MKNSTLIGILVAVSLIVLGAVSYIFIGAPARQEAAARAVVRDFGAKLQNVSLLSPDAPSEIESAYAPYVAPELLSIWESDPKLSPGRQTSSPWPDHIEILGMAKQGTGYIVQGAVVLMTSEEVENGGDAGFIPVMLQIVPRNGKWVIVAYEEQDITSPQKVE